MAQLSKEQDSLIKGWIKTAGEQYYVYSIIKKNEPDVKILFRQKYNALCQSIELALKTFLIQKGNSVKDVKAFGHDLIKLLDTAYEEYGLIISPDVYEMLAIINPDYKSRKLLYFEEEYTLPSDIGALEDTAKLLLSKVTYDNQNKFIAQ